MSAALGIDMGGTATRWVLVDAAGAEIARGRAPGANGHLYRSEARAAFAQAADALAGQLPLSPALGVHAGITGFDPAVADDGRYLLASALAVPPGAIALRDDIELAYLAAFEPGRGHLVLAGTGSVALHIAADGTVHRAGGRGILIDDGGSGAWIGLQALRAVWRHDDATGRPGEAAVLAAALAGVIGGSDWSATRAYVYGRDRGAIAELSRTVARCADDGDRIARAILSDAGREIARLARVMLGRCGPGPIALVGGVLRLHPMIFDTVREALPDVRLGRPEIDAAATAAQLALKSDLGDKDT